MAGNTNFAKKIAVNTKSFLDDSPKTTAQGYVVFSHVDAAHKALLMNNQFITVSVGNDSQDVTVRLRVDHAKPTIDASKSVFVGNLPYAADEVSLRQHFNSVCGWDEEESPVIQGVRIIRDPSTMQCKGFGYVLFIDKISIPDALRKAHQSTYMKRELRVVVCGRRLKSHNVKKKDPKRIFEGKRSTDGMNSASRRIMTSMKTRKRDPTKVTLFALKKSFEKTAQNTFQSKKNVALGISKNAASKKNTDKRIKKMQKRVNKGMGKQRKSNKVN
jgi:nucleolar protein 12